MSEEDITTYLKQYGFLIPNAEVYGVDCLNCQKRYRFDNLISPADFTAFLAQTDQSNYSLRAKCPHCQHNNFTAPRQFNLLLTTNFEITENQENRVYLRPETCQGIFINFLPIQRSTHRQLPFGIGQIGKSFRNEITLHHGIFRTREFEQMELEFFCSQEEKKTKQVPLARSELPHYARKTTDLYFQYHFGWGEVSSISDRGNYDLSQHSQHSQKDLSINRVIPQVIEVSFGVERLMLAMLEDSYREEAVKNSEAENKERKVLKLHPLLSPYFVAIIPLSKQLKESAYQLYLNLLSAVPFNLTYEEAPNVGKAYRRQDAIGTYYCLTVDFETSHDNMITCRQRDTMKQVRIKIKDIKNYLYTEYETHFQNRQKAQEIRFEKDQEKLAEKVKDASQSEIFFINERNLAKKKKLLSRLLLNDCNPKLTAKQKSQIDNYLKNLDIAPVDYNELAKKNVIRNTEPEIRRKLDQLLRTYYDQFLAQELTPTEEKLKNHGVEMIEPEVIKGRRTTAATKQADIDYIKSHPQFESSKEKVVLGLTTTDKQEIRIITDGPRIGTDSDGNPKEVNDLNYSDISWETLTETIAHELAHAIVNTLMYDGKPMLDDGGHGPLHDDFTHRMKVMIEKTPE
ncbi:3322_t:CDS:2 [Entrophospora sp. SA101]|nr:3322_t:CDS:2 [Entrophospora sp. SA101]